MRLKLNTSIDGAIDHLLLCVPEDEAIEFSGVYGALINSLPTRTSITILAQPAARAHIDAWPLDPAARARMAISDAGWRQ